MTQSANEQLGATLREIRKAHKMTLRDISNWTDLSISYLSDFERGRVGIRVSVLVHWCEVLGYDVDIRLKVKK